MSDVSTFISRRRALALGSGFAGGLIAMGATPLHAAIKGSAFSGQPLQAGAADNGSSALPVSEIEDIIQGQGTVSNGVLNIQLDRDDLHVVNAQGIPFKGAWEINDELYFQSIGSNRAIFNGNLAVVAGETSPVINRILSSGLVLQGYHQHYITLNPNIWFIHFRGVGDPRSLAEKVHYVIKATSAPLPQTMPSNPKTPLDAKRLGEILGGTAMVGSQGVVSVDVPRKEKVTLGGVSVQSDLGILNEFAFEPLGNDSSGNNTVVGAQFVMLQSEVDRVFKVLKGYGFSTECLYNQETDENPQFFYNHAELTGNAYNRAYQLREALNLTNAMFM